MIPDKIVIFGTTWRVIKSASREDVGKGDEMLWGLCDFSRREISVWTGGDTNDAQVTFYHELTHAIARETGIRMSEKDTDLFAKTFVDTMLRNDLRLEGEPKKVGRARRAKA